MENSLEDATEITPAVEADDDGSVTTIEEANKVLSSHVTTEVKAKPKANFKRTIRDLIDSGEDEHLNKIGFISTGEYKSCNPKIKRIYDAFIRIMDVSDMRAIRAKLDSNAGKLSKPIKAYKRHDYGHGNIHIAECYAYAKALIGNRTDMAAFKMATLLHDESLAYGYGRKTHHEDPMKYIMYANDYKNDVRINNTIQGFVDVDLIISREYNMVGELIRTHRVSPYTAMRSMIDKFNIKDPSLFKFIGGVSCIDKITNINPLTARNRSWDENYDIEKHFVKLRDRFLDKDSAKVNKAVFSSIFGEDDGLFIYEYFLKAVNDFDSEEFKLWNSHINFAGNEELSGKIQMSAK